MEDGAFAFIQAVFHVFLVILLHGNRTRHGVDRAAEHVRRAHVAVHQPADPRSVADRKRPVDTELVIEHLDGLRRSEVAQNRPPGITWENLAGEEYDQAENPQRKDHQPEAPQEERSQVSGLLDAGPPHAERPRAAKPSSVIDG